jgi:hypothetical protein
MSQHALKAQELAERLGGTLLDCPPDRLLTEVLPLDEAGSTSVSFLANPKYLPRARESKAGLILVDPRSSLEGRPGSCWPIPAGASPSLPAGCIRSRNPPGARDPSIPPPRWRPAPGSRRG